MTGDIERMPRLDGASFAPWRRRRLTAAGFGERLAAELAADPRVDLHALLELVDAGCAPPLAARILAPLEHGERGS